MKYSVAFTFIVAGILLYAVAFALDMNPYLFVVPSLCILEALALLVLPRFARALWGMVILALALGLAWDMLIYYQTENGLIFWNAILAWGLFALLPAGGLGIYLYKKR